MHVTSRVRRIAQHPLTHLIAAFVVFGLIQAFFIKPFVVPSGSMQNTLQVGDRILVNRTAFLGSQPEQGDVVVFAADGSWQAEDGQTSTGFIATAKSVLGWFGYGSGNQHYLVKRVIATGGQKVLCCDQQGRVTVDGTPLDEPYIFQDYPFRPDELDCTTPTVSLRCFSEVTVPAGDLFVLGDHRSNSSDSAIECRGRPPESPATDCARWASVSGVVGRTFAVVWPLGRIGGVQG